jgi:MFS family permease
MSMLVGQAPITLFTFGLFIKPLGAEFGWDRAQLSAASGVGAVFSGLAIPVIGIRMDRWGVKRVLIPVILLFAASVGALALTLASIALFTVLMVATGLFGSGQGPLDYVKCISGWFDDKRGLALGI